MHDSYEIAPDVVLTSALQGLADAARETIRRDRGGTIAAHSVLRFAAYNTPGISAAPLPSRRSPLFKLCRNIDGFDPARLGPVVRSGPPRYQLGLGGFGPGHSGLGTGHGGVAVVAHLVGVE